MYVLLGNGCSVNAATATLVAIHPFYCSPHPSGGMHRNGTDHRAKAVKQHKDRLSQPFYSHIFQHDRTSKYPTHKIFYIFPFQLFAYLRFISTTRFTKRLYSPAVIFVGWLGYFDRAGNVVHRAWKRKKSQRWSCRRQSVCVWVCFFCVCMVSVGMYGCGLGADTWLACKSTHHFTVKEHDKSIKRIKIKDALRPSMASQRRVHHIHGGREGSILHVVEQLHPEYIRLKSFHCRSAARRVRNEKGIRTSVRTFL